MDVVFQIRTLLKWNCSILTVQVEKFDWNEGKLHSRTARHNLH